jgi:carboxyl-terminal processing protease
MEKTFKIHYVLGKFVDCTGRKGKKKDKKDFKFKADSVPSKEKPGNLPPNRLNAIIQQKKAGNLTDANFSTFVNAITETMDPHTTYFPPIDLRSFNESMSGRFFGIGAQLKEDDGKIKIASASSAAARPGKAVN